MCHDLDSRPPIPPLVGAAVDGRRSELQAADGTRFMAFYAQAAGSPTRTGIVILPDVRGLHPYYEELALRFAERGIDAIAIDWFGRTAGAEARDEAFDFMPHVAQTTWAGITADIKATVEEVRTPDEGRLGADRVFVIGFCLGGRMAFLAATLGLELAGVIGLYGPVTGAGRNDAPAPIDVVDRFEAPVLGLFGGADGSIPAESVAAFDAGLAEAGVEHRLITYPGAPHSFFDRKAAEYSQTSAKAWDEILRFVDVAER